MNGRWQYTTGKLANAILAIGRCDTEAELEDAWFEHADGYADDHPDRKRLMKVYMARLEHINAADQVARLLRAG